MIVDVPTSPSTTKGYNIWCDGPITTAERNVGIYTVPIDIGERYD